jgi:hypothetical protein
MNRAAGNCKITAMADVINELVAQRNAMHEHMRQMMELRQGMMMHMMGEPGPPRADAPLRPGRTPRPPIQGTRRTTRPTEHQQKHRAARWPAGRVCLESDLGFGTSE